MNISEERSATNSLRFDAANDLQKHVLYKELVAWHTDCCSIAPLTDYMNNLITQALAVEEEYFGDDHDKKVCADLRNNFGYTNKIGNSSRNDSKMTIMIELKNELKKQ